MFSMKKKLISSAYDGIGDAIVVDSEDDNQCARTAVCDISTSDMQYLKEKIKSLTCSIIRKKLEVHVILSPTRAVYHLH